MSRVFTLTEDQVAGLKSLNWENAKVLRSPLAGKGRPAWEEVGVNEQILDFILAYINSSYQVRVRIKDKVRAIVNQTGVRGEALSSEDRAIFAAFNRGDFDSSEIQGNFESSTREAGVFTRTPSSLKTMSGRPVEEGDISFTRSQGVLGGDALDWSRVKVLWDKPAGKEEDYKAQPTNYAKMRFVAGRIKNLTREDKYRNERILVSKSILSEWEDLGGQDSAEWLVLKKAFETTAALVPKAPLIRKAKITAKPVASESSSSAEPKRAELIVLEREGSGVIASSSLAVPAPEEPPSFEGVSLSSGQPIPEPTGPRNPIIAATLDGFSAVITAFTPSFSSEPIAPPTFEVDEPDPADPFLQEPSGGGEASREFPKKKKPSTQKTRMSTSSSFESEADIKVREERDVKKLDGKAAWQAMIAARLQTKVKGVRPEIVRRSVAQQFSNLSAIYKDCLNRQIKCFNIHIKDGKSKVLYFGSFGDVPRLFVNSEEATIDQFRECLIINKRRLTEGAESKADYDDLNLALGFVRVKERKIPPLESLMIGLDEQIREASLGSDPEHVAKLLKMRERLASQQANLKKICNELDTAINLFPTDEKHTTPNGRHYAYQKLFSQAEISKVLDAENIDTCIARDVINTMINQMVTELANKAVGYARLSSLPAEASSVDLSIFNAVKGLARPREFIPPVDVTQDFYITKKVRVDAGDLEVVSNERPPHFIDTNPNVPSTGFSTGSSNAETIGVAIPQKFLDREA